MTHTPAQLRPGPVLALALLLAIGAPSAPVARAQAGPGTAPTSTGDEDPSVLFARGRELLESGDAAGAAAASLAVSRNMPIETR